MTAPWGEIIGAVASNINTGISLAANKRAQRREQLYNQKMVREQRQWTEDMYNKYQSPEALKNQYIEAGINPISADISAGSQWSSSAPEQSGSFVAPGQLIQEGLSNMVNLIGQLKQNQLTEAQINKTNAETSNIETLTEPQKQLLIDQSKQMQNQIKVANSTLDLQKDANVWQKTIAEGNLDVAQKSLAVNAFNTMVVSHCNLKKLDGEVRLLKLNGDKIEAETMSVKQATSIYREQWSKQKPYYSKQQYRQAYGDGPLGMLGVGRAFRDELEPYYYKGMASMKSNLNDGTAYVVNQYNKLDSTVADFENRVGKKVTQSLKDANDWLDKHNKNPHAHKPHPKK